MKKICTITLIGRPNVGKSSLLNKLINYDLSIISKHVQTTRDQIRGIYNDHECQFIFLDTPGIHKGKNLLSEKLNQKSYQALEESDLVMFLFPANEEIGKGDKYILHRIKDAQVNNVIGIITKIDLIKNKDILEEKVNQLKELGFKKILGVGFEHDQTYKDVINEIKNYAYDGECLYEEDEFTDVPMRFIAKEIIRENALQYLYDELPHSIAVEITEFTESEKEQIPYNIQAILYVKKESQKGILIGKGAQMIKKISMNARQKMEKIFDHKVYLNVSVKVNENWVDDETKIKQMGY